MNTLQFEYQIKNVDLLEPHRTQHLLNQYGRDGWSIDHVESLSNGARPGTVAIILYREVPAS